MASPPPEPPLAPPDADAWKGVKVLAPQNNTIATGLGFTLGRARVYVVRDKREIKHRRKDVGAVKDHIRTRWTARTQLVRWSGRRSEWCHTLPEAVRSPTRQLVGQALHAKWDEIGRS